MNVEKLTNDQAVKGYDFPVEVKAYSAGTQLIPTSATIAVKDPDGNEKLAATAMSVAALTGTMTYTVDDALVGTLWENAIIEVLYTVSSVVYKAVFFFDVVLNALKCSVTDDDLKAYSPRIAALIWTGTGAPTNYSGQIDEAFRVVKRLIKDKGRRPAMIIDGAQLRELIILKTFEMVSFDFSKDPEDIWWERYKEYSRTFQRQFEALRIQYDEDESGAIDSDEKATLGQITLAR